MIFNVSALAESMKKAWELYEGVTFEEISGNMVVIRFEDRWKMEKALNLALYESVASDFTEMMGRICCRVKEDTNVLKRKFMRYKIEFDVNTPLEDEVYFVFDEEEEEEPIWISFKYEWLQVFC
ncbi:hypothetical protein QQ045_014670 [Rhodiola kirilowii]